MAGRDRPHSSAPDEPVPRPVPPGRMSVVPSIGTARPPDAHPEALIVHAPLDDLPHVVVDIDPAYLIPWEGHPDRAGNGQIADALPRSSRRFLLTGMESELRETPRRKSGSFLDLLGFVALRARLRLHATRQQPWSVLVARQDDRFS